MQLSPGEIQFFKVGYAPVVSLHEYTGLLKKQ